MNKDKSNNPWFSTVCVTITQATESVQLVLTELSGNEIQYKRKIKNINSRCVKSLIILPPFYNIQSTLLYFHTNKVVAEKLEYSWIFGKQIYWNDLSYLLTVQFKIVSEQRRLKGEVKANTKEQ